MTTWTCGAYGAVGNGVYLKGLSIAANNNALTAPTGTFASPDVGKVISIAVAGPATGCSPADGYGACPLVTTIQGFTDSAHVTLAANATTAVSSGTGLFGSDNRAAFQAAVDLASLPNVSEYDIYIPHALGQGTASTVTEPGCYLVNGQIKLPNSSFNEYKWVRFRGDGNTASMVCEADPKQASVFEMRYPGTDGTEYWFKDFGIQTLLGYYMPSLLHCNTCPAIRVEGMWLSNAQHAVLAEAGTQIVKLYGNTFESDYEALQWGGTSLADKNYTLMASDNLIDMGAYMYVSRLTGGFTAWEFDLNYVQYVDIGDTQYWGSIGRGFQCTGCTDVDYHDNDHVLGAQDVFGIGSTQVGYQNVSLSGVTGADVHDNQFASYNAEGVDLVGNNSSVNFHGNTYKNISGQTAQPYIAITATGGTNSVVQVTDEIISSCASPCITVASGSLAAPSDISGNIFASGITTPISVGGGLDSGVYVALQSGEVGGSTETLGTLNLTAGTTNSVATGNSINPNGTIPAATETLGTLDLPAGTTNPVATGDSINPTGTIPAATETLGTLDLPAGTTNPVATGDSTNPTGTIPAATKTLSRLHADEGHCTMARGTCRAQSLSTTYRTVPNCICTWSGTGTLTGLLKCPSTKSTIAPASTVGTDSAVVNWLCLGN